MEAHSGLYSSKFLVHDKSGDMVDNGSVHVSGALHHETAFHML